MPMRMTKRWRRGLRVAMADISWRWRVMLEGPRVVEFLAKLVTRDVSKLAPGTALKALWLADGGGVRGVGVFARYGRESFLLAASAPDMDWIAAAAVAYNVKLRELTESTAVSPLSVPPRRRFCKRRNCPSTSSRSHSANCRGAASK